MELQELLTLHPWNEKWKANRKIEAIRTFQCAGPIETVWAQMTDTSSWNRRLGLPQMQLEEKNGVLFGWASYGGWKAQWEEEKWQWNYLSSMKAGRIYSRGPGRYVRSIVLFRKVDENKTEITVYFGWVPSGWIGAILLRWKMPELLLLYGREIEKITQAAEPGKEVYEEIQINEEALRKAQLVLSEQNDLKPLIKNKILDFLKYTPDDEILRIRIRKLAAEWNVPLRDLLGIFLRATRGGLFTLTWDMICPHCLAVRSEISSLGEIPKRVKCEACEIDFGTEEHENLEVTFHPHPSIRNPSPVFFCAAEPAKKSHIKILETVDPGESIKMIQSSLEDGRYRLRLQGEKHYTFLDVENIESSGNFVWKASWNGGHARISKHPCLWLLNNTPERKTFIVEEYRTDREALRPADLFNFQEFRDLFSREVVAQDVKINVGKQTILFTDVVGSTRFYLERGDADAFSAVRKHFIQIHNIVTDHGGAVVKTIGDSAMAGFNNASDALRASIEMQKQFAQKSSLAIRISMHTGPCLAVSLNTGIDYFGRTVNLAAKFQPLVHGDEIGLSESTLSESGVHDIISKHKYIEKEILLQGDETGRKLLVVRPFQTIQAPRAEAGAF